MAGSSFVRILGIDRLRCALAELVRVDCPLCENVTRASDYLWLAFESVASWPEELQQQAWHVGKATLPLRHGLQPMQNSDFWRISIDIERFILAAEAFDHIPEFDLEPEVFAKGLV